MGVGAYITKDDVAANYGSDSPVRRQPAPFSSRGPREDGALQAGGRRARRGGLDDADVADRPARGRHVHPAAGLLDAQRHVDGLAAGGRRGGAADQRGQAGRHARAAPAQLRQALNSSARFIDRYRVRAGQRPDQRRHGLGPAEDQHQDGRHHLVACRCTRCSAGSSATPAVGQGIYDREGVSAGSSYTRTYTFTRTSGPSQPMNYKLRWVGNDGTFSSDNQVQLRLNEPATLDVRVNPRAAGSIRRSSRWKAARRTGSRTRP